MLLPIDETPVETEARLMKLAREELDEAVAQRGIEATAVDGSLSSGRLWPSSDLDVTVVPDSGPNWNVDWRVRGGLVVHKHINRWPLLDDLRSGYPQSFVNQAAGDWVRDPTWLLDGLASLKPVHDPGGRLGAFRCFMAEHRFRPEVTLPRRPLLLTRALKLAGEAGSLLESGDGAAAMEECGLAMEALALIWLEAGERMISLKEMDVELRRVCAALGAPAVHGLFRAAVGVPALQDHLAGIKAALWDLLVCYSPFVDEMLTAPIKTPAMQRRVAVMAYLRHRIWSGLYAGDAGCLIHLTTIRQSMGGWDTQSLLAGEEGEPPSESPERVDAIERIEAARERVLEMFPLTPVQECLAALAELSEISRRTFSIKV